MSILEDISGVLFSPVSTFREILEAGPSLPRAALIVLLASISNGLSGIAAQGAFISLAESLPGLGASPNVGSITNPVELILRSVIGGFFGWGFLTGVLFPISRFLGGTGEFRDTLALLGFAMLPDIFQAPVAAVVMLTGGLAGTLISGIFGLIIGIWILVLDVLAVRESQKISTSRAIAAVLITLTILILAFLFIISRLYQ
jgi:hypothetical protein